ncbi:MAG TPA: hypothetical protein VFV59_01120 [Candidatus Limnocylindria bacterium]|nr:hypothetical protein [Candidatus Limnocylindria bacterium]
MSAARKLAPMTSEERIARAIAAIRTDLEPDPLFQRRLRSEVLGRYVAAREGAVVPERGRPAKEMGRLGRAVLYASFALGLSVTGVMAASQQAVPGDLLYPLKRDIEALRHRVLPAEFEELLARVELKARLDELAAVAERGDAAAVVLLADEVHQSYGAVIEQTADSPQNLVVLDALLERLPERARAAVSDVVLDVDRATHPAPSRPVPGQGRRGESPAYGRDDGSGKGPAAAPPTDASDSTGANPVPTASPEPTESSAEATPPAAAPSADADAQAENQGADADQ